MTGKGERTRQAIVEQALVVAGEVGLSQLTVGTLAERTGLSKSGLFAHFKAREALQLAVLNEALARFTNTVFVPALQHPRGEPRVRALFEGYLKWIQDDPREGGCFFMSLTFEFDDQPGPLRDRLQQAQRDWVQGLVRAARLAIKEGHFRADLDPEAFAWELLGINLAFQHGFKVLGDAGALLRARASFEALLRRSGENSTTVLIQRA
jgi:AcrR family transcriptional regulator